MQAKLLGFLVTQLLKLLTGDMLKMVADMILDFVEKYVIGTKSEIDDALILPICKLIRVTFNIPDDDDIN